MAEYSCAQGGTCTGASTNYGPPPTPINALWTGPICSPGYIMA